MIREALAASLLALGLGVTSCAVLIGLEDRPGRPDDGDAASDAGSDGPGEPRFDECDGSFFCDDFDHGPFAEKWGGLSEQLLPGTYVTGDASVSPLLFEGAKSAPSVLEAQGERTDALAAAFLAHGIDVPAGTQVLEARADVRLVSLEDLRDGGMEQSDSGPEIIFRYPRLNILGLYDGEGGGTAEAVFSSHYLGLVTGQLFADRDVYGPAIEADVRVASGAWIRVFLAVGGIQAINARAEATKRAMPPCPPASQAVAVLWNSLIPQQASCLSIGPAFVTPAGRKVAVAAGLVLGDRARARVYIDNVRVDAIP